MRTALHIFWVLALTASLLFAPLPGEGDRAMNGGPAGAAEGAAGGNGVEESPSAPDPEVDPLLPSAPDPKASPGPEIPEPEVVAPPQDLRTFRAQDSGERRAALEKLARMEQDPSRRGLLGPIRYARGYLLALEGKGDEAEALLSDPLVGESALADHALFLRARLAAERKEWRRAISLLEDLLGGHPDSLFQVKARRDLVRLLRENGRVQDALRETDLLAAWAPERVPPEEIFFLRGECWDALGNASQARREFERVWYDAPASPLARQVQTKRTWRTAIRAAEATEDRFELQLRRAEILFASRRFGEAAEEYEALRKRWAARMDADRLALRLGTCHLEKKRYEKAAQELARVSRRDRSLRGEADYLAAVVLRRQGKEKAFRDAIERLAADPGAGEYRARALARLAESLEAEGKIGEAVETWGRALAAGPTPEDADRANDRLAWGLFATGYPALARPHFEQIAAGAADPHDRARGLYWAGKCLQAAGDAGGAERLWRRAYSEFPNDYYGDRARRALDLPVQRLAGGESPVSPDRLAGRLAAVRSKFPREHAARRNLDRVEALVATGLYGEAEEELEWIGTALGESTESTALRMDLAARAGHHREALLLFRELHPDHRSRADIPVEDWRTAYPRRYLRQIREAARAEGLETDFVLALIHQESVFEPGARSWVGARGLMQIMPETGRTIARKLKVRPYRADMLDDVPTNLRFGTFYLRGLLDDFQGSKPMALAGYNAGPGRSKRWWERAGGDTDLFIESIPFGETRNYVKRILFNEMLYRRIYPGGEGSLAGDEGEGVERRASREESR